MKSVAFICKYSWIGISSSLINSAIYWESKGYSVDIYAEKPDQGRFPLPVFKKENINFIITDINAKALIDDILFRFKYFRKIEYEWIICFDYSGLIRGGFSSMFSHNKLIYHSLEFFEPRYGSKYFKDMVMKILERYFSKKAKYIFTQDFYRRDYLSLDLRQNHEKFRIVYNSPISNPIYTTSDYFRETFNIPKNKIIVLCVGSLIKDHCVIDLVNSVNTWSKNFVLVLHGWFPFEDIRNYVHEIMKNLPERIFISEILFNNTDKTIPFLSCDIGFVGFHNDNNNMKYAAGSAGKLFDFLQVGRPVIALNAPGMKNLVASGGMVFNHWEEMSSVLDSININYREFSSNCVCLSEKYRFDKQYDTFFYYL